MTHILADFQANLAQCDMLIANAHQTSPGGSSLLPAIDRQQVTVAGFLNMFIAWEGFLESALTEFMVGGLTIKGQAPLRYVSPRTVRDAQAIVIGVMRYFDYANHANYRKLVGVYFDKGYPFEPHLSGLVSDLDDLKVMRNASAHISSTTQKALEALALRIFGQPRGSTTLYKILTAIDPRQPVNETVFLVYKNKLLVAAELIANG